MQIGDFVHINVYMKKYLLTLGAIVAVLLTSCQSEKTFEVKGQFLSGTDQTLYLEHRALGGVELIDSVVLKEKGEFKFKAPIPHNPEFYHLRVGSHLGVFVVDAEASEPVYITGDLDKFNSTFSVVNSPVNDQIKQIDQSTRHVKLVIKELEQKHNAQKIDDLAYLSEIDSLLTDYKSEMIQLILGSPSSAAAYYAVFQKVNDYLIFDPYDKRDYPMFGAVATSWDKYYKDTPRTQHLYDFTMQALTARKQQERQEEMLENTPVVTDSALPDISLRDMNGKRVSLASLKGKVVVLDFTVYGAEFSPQHNYDINTIYTQFKNRGVEVYQISFDSDEHLWKNAATNLPWVTVRDPESVYSRLLALYNVRDLPTAFVVDKNGDITARVEDYKTLVSEINKAL